MKSPWVVVLGTVVLTGCNVFDVVDVGTTSSSSGSPGGGEAGSSSGGTRSSHVSSGEAGASGSSAGMGSGSGSSVGLASSSGTRSSSVTVPSSSSAPASSVGVSSSSTGTSSSSSGGSSSLGGLASVDPGPVLPAGAGCIQSGPWVDTVTREAMAVDAHGNQHVAYGGDAVRYAHNDGTGWRTRVLEPRGKRARVVLDATGQPVVFFERPLGHVDESDGPSELRVMEPNGAATVSELILTTEWPRVVSVAISTGGTRFVAVVEDGARQAGTYSSQGSGWSFEPFPQASVGFWRYGETQLEAAPDGSVYAAWPTTSGCASGAAPCGVLVSRHGPQGWGPAEVAAGLARDSDGFAMTVDTNSRPVVVVPKLFSPRFGLSVVRQTATGWSAQDCQTADARSDQLAARVLADGSVEVALMGYQSTRRVPLLVNANAGVCTARFLGEGILGPAGEGDSGPSVPLSYAHGGTLSTMVFLEPRGALRARMETATEVLDSVLQTSRSHGNSAAAFARADGTLLVASVVLPNGELVLSAQDGEGHWSHEVVPTSDAAQDCAVQAVPRYRTTDDPEPTTVDVLEDAQGNVHVAYSVHCAATAITTRGSRKVGGLWTAQDVAPDADGGVRLVLTDQGYPVVSVGSALYRYNGANWTRFDLPGIAASLIMDDSGRPLAATHRSGSVMTAAINAGSSQVQTTTIASGQGKFATARVRQAPNGTLHAAWVYSQSQGTSLWNMDIAHATYSGSAWTADSVATSTGPGTETRLDLAVDAENRPVVAFLHRSDRALKVARWSGVEWRIVTVPTDGDNAGHYISMRVHGAEAWVVHQDAEVKSLCVGHVPLP
jgi:hypothetical protein